MTNVTKLTGSNFLMWSRQVHALLDGYDLAGYIVGSIAVPSATITSDDDITTNPAYTLWKRQDRLIYSSLLDAITPTIQPILSTASSASEIWQTLTMTYAKPSRAHVKHIRQQIQNWKKGSKSINEYFQGLTTRFDEQPSTESTSHGNRNKCHVPIRSKALVNPRNKTQQRKLC